MGLTRIRAEQISDIDYKQAVRVVQTTNITLSGGAPSAVDGVNLSANDRVLVTGQNTGSQNGLYRVQTIGTGANGTWVRTSDGNAQGEIESGMIVMVTEGEVYKDTLWKLTTNNPITLGSTSLTFELNTEFGFGNIYANGTGVMATVQSDVLTLVAGENMNVIGNAVAKTITFSVGGTAAYGNANVVSYGETGWAGNIIPAANITYNLGSNTNRWKDIWLANSTIYIGSAQISADGTAVVLPANTVVGNNPIVVENQGNITACNFISTDSISAVGNISGGNLSGTNITGTLTTATQTNITSVGTLSSLSVTGNVSSGNVLGTTGTFTNIAGTLTTAAQPNITSVGTLSSLTATGNITGGNLVTTGIITSGSQNITGNVDITGNVNVTGNLNYANVTDLVVGDPLIYIGEDNPGNVYDLGMVVSWNDGTYQHGGWVRDASDGTWKLFGNVVSEPTTVIDFTNAIYQPMRAGAITATTGTFSGNVSTGNISGTTGTFTNIAGTLTTAAQTNITSVGTLGSLTVTGNITGGNLLGKHANGTSSVDMPAAGGNVNLTAGGATSLVVTSTGANITGTLNATGNANVGNIGATNGVFTNVAGTLTTAAQTNITSVGTLGSLTVTGNVTIDTSTLFVDSVNNRVGVGTASPAVDLHVVGTATRLQSADTSPTSLILQTGATAARYPQFTIQNYDSFGGFGVVELQRSRGTSAAPTSVQSGDILGGFNTWGGNGASFISATRIEGVANATFSSSVDAYLRMLTTSAGTQSERVRIDPTGNVGIGTTTPAYKLDVRDSAATGQGLRVTGGGTGGPIALFERDIGASGSYISINCSGNDPQVNFTRASASGSFSIGTDDGGYFKISNGLIGTNDRLTVDPTGNVGIGTTTPLNKFEVTGNTGQLFTVSDSMTGTIYSVNDISGIPAIEVLSSGLVKIAQYGGNVMIGTGTDAGYKLYVNGSFAATTKSFVIDHPTRPGMNLRYTCLEGPENGVYVRGRSQSQVIDLPDYWTGLVDESSITVDLTPHGRHQLLYVVSIRDNQVIIGSDTDGDLDYSYTVWATRKDVPPLIVEY